MDGAAAYEFDAGDIRRLQREQEDASSSAPTGASSPHRQGHAGEDDDDDHFTVNLNPRGRARRTSSGGTEPPPLPVKFIDEEQEARAVADLTAGLLGQLHAPLERLEDHLLELHRNQQLIVAGLANENEKLANLPHWHEIAEVMSKAPPYHQRLHGMRTQMVDLSARVHRLKVRSAKLKQRKLAAEEKERQLTAQPAASLLMRRAGGESSAGTTTATSGAAGSRTAGAKDKERI